MRRTFVDMEPIVEAYQNRNCSQEEFCKKVKISKAVLQYWVGKMKKGINSDEELPLFQPMEISNTMSAQHIEIETKAGLIIRIPTS